MSGTLNKRKEEDSKRSVFDRLGPDVKSSSSNTSTTTIAASKMSNICPSYAKTGYCQLGSKCKYDHTKKDGGKDDSKSKSTSKKEKGVLEQKSPVRSREAESRLKSAVTSKSRDDTDKKSKKTAEISTSKSSKSARSPSPVSKKKSDEKDQFSKPRDKKLQSKERQSTSESTRLKCGTSGSGGGGNASDVVGKLEKLSSKSKKSDAPLQLPPSSSSSKTQSSSNNASKKASDVKQSSSSTQPRDGKNMDADRGFSSKTQSKNSASSDISKTVRSDFSKKETFVDKREVTIKKDDVATVKDKKEVDSTAQPPKLMLQTSLSPKKHQKAKTKTSTEAKKSQKPKVKRRRRASESSYSSSSSGSGSSSSSSGSSTAGASSRSSYYSSSEDRSLSHDRKGAKEKAIKKKSSKVTTGNPPLEKKSKRKPKEDSSKKMSGVTPPSSKGNKQKHSRDLSDRSIDKEQSKRSKSSLPKASEPHPLDMRGYSPSSPSPPPRFSSRCREDRYYEEEEGMDERRRYSGRNKLDVAGSHDSRRVKVDRYRGDDLSPGLADCRRKVGDGFYEEEERGEEFRFRKNEYDSLERRRSRERERPPLYDMPEKEIMYADEPNRRDRHSRRGQWEADELPEGKLKRRLSDELFSPDRKKKRRDYRDRSDKMYETDGRKREYEREDESLMDEMSYKVGKHGRSTPDSWHHHHDNSGERRSRRDRSVHSKRGGDYYDYDMEIGRRSLSRSSLSSKPAGIPGESSRYYESKRPILPSSSMVGSLPGIVPSHLQPLTPYDYREPPPYHITPESDPVDGRGYPGRPGSGKPSAPFWDDYRRIESGSAVSAPYRGGHTHARGIHPQPGTLMPTGGDWETSRVKQQSSGPHDWDNRYERSSEEFRNRREVLLPPPPRPRHETASSDHASSPAVANPVSSVAAATSAVAVVAACSSSAEHLGSANKADSTLSQDAPASVCVVPSAKPMKFDPEGYKGLSDDELDEEILLDGEAVAGGADDDGGEVNQSVDLEDEDGVLESLPKKIPLVDISDIEWTSLVMKDEERSMKLSSGVSKNHSAADIFREIGLSKEFAGEELFEKINSLLAADACDSRTGGCDDDGDKKNAEISGEKKRMVDGEKDGEDSLEEAAANGHGDDVHHEEEMKEDHRPVVKEEPETEMKEEIPQKQTTEMTEAVVQLLTESDSSLTTEASKLPSDDFQCLLKCESLLQSNFAEEKDNKVDTCRVAETCNAATFDDGDRPSRLLHDIASFHVTAFFKAKRRQNIVKDIGPYRNALCARKDLAIRRSLCRVEREELVMFPVQLVDRDLYSLSVQLFRQSRGISGSVPVVVEEKTATTTPGSVVVSPPRTISS